MWLMRFFRTRMDTVSSPALELASTAEMSSSFESPWAVRDSFRGLINELMNSIRGKKSLFDISTMRMNRRANAVGFAAAIFFGMISPKSRTMKVIMNTEKNSGYFSTRASESRSPTIEALRFTIMFPMRMVMSVFCGWPR